MEHSEIFDVKKARKAMTIAMTAATKKIRNSSEIMKESVMEELETDAMNTDSGEIVKEPEMEELETNATMNLDSSKVVDKLAMEGKLTSSDTTSREDRVHAPYPFVFRKVNSRRGGKCQCEVDEDRFPQGLIFKPIPKKYCRICKPNSQGITSFFLYK